MKKKKEIVAALQVLPGIGPSIAEDLFMLGFRGVDDLKGADPEEMFERLCSMRGGRLDRCLLYTFRSAIYAASCPEPKKELLQWWRWK